jgi:hemolysin activation/secretion protein
VRWLNLAGISLAISTGMVSKTIAQTQETIPPNAPEIINPTLPTPVEPPTPEVPQPPPQPPLEIPPASQPPGCLSPSHQSDRFLVTKIEVKGNTVLEKEIQQAIAPLENRELTFEDLICLRSQITQLYITNGYITSGAFLPNNQDLSSGIVQIQVVEGKLEDIEITGLQRLEPGYARSRLKLGATQPLKQQNLDRALKLLQLDPLIARVNAELTAGSTPGQSILIVNLTEAPAFHAGISTDNYRSPSIGSYQGSIFLSHDNVFGFGERLSAAHSLTEGLDIGEFNYTVPWNALNGTFTLSYSNSNSDIVEEDFRDFDISSKTENFSVSLRQPVLREPDSEFALGLALDLRRSQTFLQGEPFSFSVGTENGEAKVSVIRFFQDWVDRTPKRVLAIRSQFSFGIGAFDATINNTGTDGRFFSWLGQFQWVQQLSPRALLVTRLDTQLTADSLLPIEQFGIGGIGSVRGYRQNQMVTDNGVFGSLEVRLPLTSDPSVLQLTPFFEAGTGWNNSEATDPDPSTLVSLGLGLRWLITSGLDLRLDYGIALTDVGDRGDSLQENGFYFSLRYQPF